MCAASQKRDPSCRGCSRPGRRSGRARTSPIGWERLAAAGVLVEEELTQRERIVLSALSRNATLRQIAQQEYISPNTVKTHVRNIYRKLGVSDRDGVTAAAQALGLLWPGRPPGRQSRAMAAARCASRSR